MLGTKKEKIVLQFQQKDNPINTQCIKQVFPKLFSSSASLNNKLSTKGSFGQKRDNDLTHLLLSASGPPIVQFTANDPVNNQQSSESPFDASEEQKML